MPVSASDLTVGPTDIYWALFSDATAVEPATPTTSPHANWTFFGATDGGVKLTIGQKFEQQYVDQTGYPLASSLDTNEVVATFNLTRVNSVNLKVLMNGGNITTAGSGSGAVDTFEPVIDLVTNDPVYFKFLMRGKAPVSDTGFANQKRDIFLRKLLQTDDLEYNTGKTDKSVLTAAVLCHYVSNSVQPWAMNTMNATA